MYSWRHKVYSQILKYIFHFILVLEKFPDATPVPGYRCIPSNTDHAEPAKPPCDMVTFSHFGISGGFGF